MDLAAQGSSEERERGLVSALQKPVDAATVLVVLTIGIAAATLLLARDVVPAAHFRPLAFPYLFKRDEPAAAWLSCATILAATLFAWKWPSLSGNRLVARLNADPRAFIGGATAVLALAALLVYRAHPLSMDEYAPVFQAGAFARLRLTGKVPPELLSRLIPPMRWFIEAAPSGEMISTYWPGFALLLTPFMWLGCPWLLNPLIGGASLYLIWRLARALWPVGMAAGWAVLFAAASPAFMVNAISFYSMPAHLFASLLFAFLLLEQRLIAAGAVGSFALALHNPLPHALFALPWILAVAARPGRMRNLFRLALGYLPGVALGAGWFFFRAHFGPTSDGAQGAARTIASVVQGAFTGSPFALLWDRSVNVAELALWAVPALLPLAMMGAWQHRRERAVLLLSASAAATFLGYLFVPFDQGHGWGFRYFHSAWGVLPLLAAAGLQGTRASDAALRRLMLVAALGSLVCGNFLRFAQVRTFMDAQLAQLPPQSEASLEIVMVHVNRGYYTIDLVQNDPFLEGRRWMLFGFGADDDAKFMRSAFPRARLVRESELFTVWRID